MPAKFIFIAGVLGVGGYVGHKAMSHDADIFPMASEQVASKLIAARLKLPRRDKDGFIEIWSTGRSVKGVALEMRYADWAPIQKCQASITAIDAERTRIVPDCSTSVGTGGSALAKTSDEMGSAFFDEHIQAIMNDREFNRKRVDNMQMGAAMRNMGGMQREALRTHDEIQQLEAEQR